MSRKNTPSPELLRSLLARAQAEKMDRMVIERLAMLLHCAEATGSVSETCRKFGIARSTYHRWLDRFDPENVHALADKQHDPIATRQSEVSAETVDLVRRYRMRYPHLGKERISEKLLQEHAVDISASTVGRIIERECLYFADTPFHHKKRAQISQPQSCGTGMPSQETHQHIAILPEEEHIPSPEKTTLSSHKTTTEPAGVTISWQSVLRFMIVLSVLTNAVFAGLFLLSAATEKQVDAIKDAPVPAYQFTEPLHTAPSAIPLP